MIDIKPSKLGETKKQTGLDSAPDNNSAGAHGVLFYILMVMLLLK